MKILLQNHHLDLRQKYDIFSCVTLGSQVQKHWLWFLESTFHRRPQTEGEINIIHITKPLNVELRICHVPLRIVQYQLNVYENLKKRQLWIMRYWGWVCILCSSAVGLSYLNSLSEGPMWQLKEVHGNGICLNLIFFINVFLASTGAVYILKCSYQSKAWAQFNFHSPSVTASKRRKA